MIVKFPIYCKSYTGMFLNKIPEKIPKPDWFMSRSKTQKFY